LNESRDDGSDLHLNAAIDSDGQLCITGHDLGPVTRPVSSDGEYEYWYTIQEHDIPALIVALGGAPGDDILAVLEDGWTGSDSYGLDAAIRKSGVPFSFHAYS
jgi:hypothetical protein